MITAKQPEDDRLFKIIIEQIKLPLLHIARQTEAANYGSNVNYADINSVAEMSLKMIDSFLLTKGQNSQTSLELEPVSVSSVLNSAADNLYDMAKLYNCSVELRIAGKYGPVMSEKHKLEAALTMLGYSYIEANTANIVERKRGRILLTAYRSSKGLVAGVFSPEVSFTNEQFQKSLDSFGSTRQAIPEVIQSTGAGIFIANSLLNDLTTKLRVAHYKKLSGLAATLLPSQQLQFI